MRRPLTCLIAFTLTPVAAALAGPAGPMDRDAAPASAHVRDAGWLPHARQVRRAEAEAAALAEAARPLPVMPPGPTEGDWAREGWAGASGIAAPQDETRIPWLRSAMEARVFLFGLPAGDAASARDRIEACVVRLLAQHGRIFDNPRLQALASRLPGYVPSGEFTLARLSEGEREALDVLGRRLLEMP